MNRKRALYCYEFGNMKWFLVAGMVCCLLAIFSFYSYFGTAIAMYGEWDMFDFSNDAASFIGIILEGMKRLTPIALIALSFMVMFQFSDYHKRNRREYMVSLPFSQRERFVTKFLVGNSILTIICVVFGVGIFMLRNTYVPYYVKRSLVFPEYQIFCKNDTWFQTLRVILLLWVTMLTAYAVFTIIHTLISVGIVASVVSLGVMATPYYLLGMFYIYAEMFSPAANHQPLMESTFGQICRSFVGAGYYKNMVDISFGSFGDEQTRGVIDYGSMSAVFLTLIIVFVMCTLFAYIINAGQDGAKFGSIIPMPWARAFFSGGIALCFSFPISVLMVGLLDKENVGIVVAVVQIVVMIVLYFVNQKIFTRVIR